MIIYLVYNLLEYIFLDRVSLDLPTIEVRFQNLNVDAEAHLGKSASPTIFRYFIDLAQVIDSHL